MTMPDMTGKQYLEGNIYAGYVARVELFRLGTDNDDDQSMLESLLTRGLDGSGDIVILSQKDSISPTTGIFTCVIHYMERRPSNAEGTE